MVHSFFAREAEVPLFFFRAGWQALRPSRGERRKEAQRVKPALWPTSSYEDRYAVLPLRRFAPRAAHVRLVSQSKSLSLNATPKAMFMRSGMGKGV